VGGVSASIPAPRIRGTLAPRREPNSVDAFNPHETGHAKSLQILTAIQERGDPVIVPALLMPEIASAVARATGDRDGAVRYALATAALPI